MSPVISVGFGCHAFVVAPDHVAQVGPRDPPGKDSESLVRPRAVGHVHFDDRMLVASSPLPDR